MKNSFLLPEELKRLGFKSLGEHVFISRFASFYEPATIELGDHVRIDDFCILSGNIKLGNYIHISAGSSLYGRYGIEMKDYTGLSPKCTLFSAVDDFSGNFMISPLVDPKFTNVTGGKILLKKYSQVGCNCVIMPSITVGEGAIAGALSLIKSDLDPWKIYGGVPARYIMDRSKELLKFGL